MNYTYSDSYYKQGNNRKAEQTSKTAETLEKLQTPKVALAVNLADQGVKANLVKLLENPQGFSIENVPGKQIKVIAGDVTLQITAGKREKEALANILSETQDHYDLGQKRYAANFLLRKISELETVKVKSKTIFEAPIERSLKPSSNDRLAGVLASGDVALDLGRSLKTGKVELSVNDGNVSLSIAGKPKGDASYQALARAINGCLETHASSSSVEKALALTKLIDNFSFKNEKLDIKSTADNTLSSAKPVKTSFPENLNSALSLAAANLLKSSANEIEVAVVQNANPNVWSLEVENATSKLAVDIDSKLIVAKDPKAVLEALAVEIKEKATSLLNSESGVAQLSEFISKKLQSVPRSKLSESAPIVEIGLNDESAYYDLNDGKQVNKPDYKVPNSSYKSVYKKWQQLDGQLTVAEEAVDLKAASLGEQSASVAAEAKAELEKAEGGEPFTATAPQPEKAIANDPFAALDQKGPEEEAKQKEAIPTGAALSSKDKIIDVETEELPPSAAKEEQKPEPVAATTAPSESRLKTWWNNSRFGRFLRGALPANAVESSETSGEA